jgi:hypothetical protein
MKKKNNRPIEIEIINFGEYSEWESDNQQLPKFIRLALEVKAAVGVEFGMIVEIRKARNRYLDFRIDHPPFLDDSGEMSHSFTDTFRVKHNPFLFFLGDTIWEPLEDKRGAWVLTILEGKEVLATKTIHLI